MGKENKDKILPRKKKRRMGSEGNRLFIQEFQNFTIV